MPETFTEEDFTGTTTAPVKFSENDFAEPAKFSESDFSNTPSLQPVLNAPGLPAEPVVTKPRVEFNPFQPIPAANRVPEISLFGGEDQSLLGFIPEIPKIPEPIAQAIGSLPLVGGMAPGAAGVRLGAGAVNAGIGMAKGVTTPLALATLGEAAIPETAANLIGRGAITRAAQPLFAAQMAQGAVQAVPETIKAIGEGDVQQAATAGLGGLASAFLAKHLAETPLDRIAAEVAASPTPITAGTVAAMREAAVAPARNRIFEADFRPKPQEAPGANKINGGLTDISGQMTFGENASRQPDIIQTGPQTERGNATQNEGVVGTQQVQAGVETANAWLQAIEGNDPQAVSHSETALLGQPDAGSGRWQDVLDSADQIGAKIRAPGDYGDSFGSLFETEGTGTSHQRRRSGQPAGEPTGGQLLGTHEAALQSASGAVVEAIQKLQDLRSPESQAQGARILHEMLSVTKEGSKERADIVDLIRKAAYARSVESSVSLAGSEPPGPAAQVAAGVPGEVQQPTGARPAEVQGETPQATAGETPAEVAPIAGTPQATARAPIYPEEQGPLQLGIRPGGGTAGTAIHDLFTGFAEKVNDAAQNVRGTIGTLAGRSLPRITLLNREAGEAGVRYGSSNVAAPYVAEDFARRVIADSEVDPRKFGAALTEDNLRSIRQSFADEGKTDQAAAVRSLIGAKGSPFKTEAEYQAFLKEPSTQAAIERHKQLWSEEVDPIYRKAADLDPDLELASRGLQTGARINLFADRVGLETSPRDAITFGTGTRLTGTFRRKTPFATRATGAAETYFTNYDDMMANTFAKQMEIANKRIFDDKLVEAGLAVIDKPGKDVTIHDKPALAFPIRRGPNSLNIYVDPRIANEYRIASNTYTPWLSTGATKKVANAINGMQLAGLVDPVVHISNLGTVLLTRPNVAGGNIFVDSLLSATGRADVGVRLIGAAVRGVREALSGTKTSPAQLRELAEIGALRGKQQGKNPGSRLIGWVDQTVRLAMDRTYQRLAEDGLLDKSETARREFVNQAGQYNKRLQDFVTVFLRSSNLGPFATAGKNFVALGWRNSPFAGFGHGSVATSAASSLALRANVMSKLIGSAVFVGAANYLLTGKVAGRPGTPIGRIDTGKSDDNGRPLTIPAFDLLGFGRSLRVTGLRGALDAKRLGLDNPTALDAAYRDMFNAVIAPAMGPVPKTVLSVGNIPSGINVPKPNPVVFPGESQLGSNLANTAYGANTVVAGLREAGALGKLAPWLPYVNQLPPKPGLEVLSRQVPRLTPTPGKPAEMVAKYPEIVLKAKSRDVIEDVIRRARQMEPAVRKRYLTQSINKLPESEREMAEREMIRRKVMTR